LGLGLACGVTMTMMMMINGMWCDGPHLLDLLVGRVPLLGLVVAAQGEHDQLGLILLEPLHVRLKRLHLQPPSTPAAQPYEQSVTREADPRRQILLPTTGAPRGDPMRMAQALRVTARTEDSAGFHKAL
jgi:hypothetical protein